MATVHYETELVMPEQDAGFIRRWQVRERTNLSDSEIYRREQAGTFPKRIRLGPRLTVWSVAEIAAWERAVLEQRDAELDDHRPRVGGRYAEA